MHIETVLNATMRGWRAGAFAWGTTDCLMSIGNYARDLTGSDPAALWRGTYSDAEGARAIVAQFGGGAGLLHYALTGIGFTRAQEPMRGDVVAVRFPEAEIGGICLGRFIAMRMEKGRVQVRTELLDIVGVWRP